MIHDHPTLFVWGPDERPRGQLEQRRNTTAEKIVNCHRHLLFVQGSIYIAEWCMKRHSG